MPKEITDATTPEENRINISSSASKISARISIVKKNPQRQLAAAGRVVSYYITYYFLLREITKTKAKAPNISA